MSRRNPSSFEGEARDTQGFTDLHFSNLFDQYTDESGESYDLATGEPYRDSLEGHLGARGMHLTELVPENSDDEDEKVSEFIDAWLRKHGAQYPDVDTTSDVG